MKRKGIMPNDIFYNAVISTCEKGQEPRQTLTLLEVMKSKGLMPNVLTYNTATNTARRARCRDKP